MSDEQGAIPDRDAGTFACPICGKDTPHYHSPEEVERHRETEAWVEESWQQTRPHFFPDATPAADRLTDTGEVKACDFWLGDCRRCGKRADRDNQQEPCIRPFRTNGAHPPRNLSDDGETM